MVLANVLRLPGHPATFICFALPSPNVCLPVCMSAFLCLSVSSSPGFSNSVFLSVCLSPYLCLSLSLSLSLFLSVSTPISLLVSVSVPLLFSLSLSCACLSLSPQSVPPLESESTSWESPRPEPAPQYLRLYSCRSVVLAQRAETWSLCPALMEWRWHRLWVLVLTITLSAPSAVCRHACGEGFCSRPNLCTCANGKLAPSCGVSQGKRGWPLVGGEG